MLFDLANRKRFPVTAIVLAIGATLVTGCESTRYWWNNGKMVGPNYRSPSARVASGYQPHSSDRILNVPSENLEWWRVLNDPELDQIIDTIKSQNLTLMAACYRIKESRHLWNIARANLLPQNQNFTGSYAHSQLSQNSATAFPGTPVSIDDWSLGFDAAWELDLWGRIRRSVTAAEAGVQATIHDRDFAMISLIADAASLYVQIRSLDERIELARENVELQEGSLKIAEIRFDEGRTSKLDVVQAESNLASTQALIPQFELARQQALNALAVLSGVPPSDVPFLVDQPGKIPVIPRELIVGIPAELLTRRPDIRAAERNMAAQFEQIGIAEAAMYPTFALTGTLGWQAARLGDLIESGSFNGTFAPAFSWSILNFGRLKQQVCVEEARFKQIQLDFENTVLNAQREVEDGIIEFVKRNEQLVHDLKTEEANKESVDLAVTSFKEGKTDFGRVFVVQSNLVLAQDRVVETRANIAFALINTYRALGGGWETDPSCTGCQFDCKAETVASVEAGSREFVDTPGRVQPINVALLFEKGAPLIAKKR